MTDAVRICVALQVLALTALLGGCQSYESAPLELDAHRGAFELRAHDAESLTAFVERIRTKYPASITEDFDLSDGLTASEAEVVSLFYNADLRLARIRASLTLAEFENAGNWQDPVFGFDAAEIISPQSAFHFGTTVSITLPVSGRLKVSRDRASAAHAAQLRQIVDEEWQTRRDVRLAWIEWSAALERARMNRDLLEQVERIQRITSELETAGELARVESRLLRVEVSERTAALRGAESDAHQARARVLSLLGLPATADLELIPTLTAPTHLPGDLDLHDLLDQLVVSNTSLAVKRADYQVAEEALRLEVQKQYPDITIGPGFGREDDDRLLLGVSLPIPILNANRGSIAEARLQRDGARAEVEVTYEYLANSLASALTLLDSVRAQRLMYQDQITPMLAAQAEEIEQLAQFGEINTLLTLDTISRQFIAKQRLLDLHTNELRTAIAITHLLGPEADPLPASVTEVDTHLRPVAPHTYPNGAGGNS